MLSFAIISQTAAVAQSVNTTSTYGIVALNPDALTTPWPVSAIELVFTAIIGIWGLCVPGKPGLTTVSRALSLYTALRSTLLGTNAIRSLIDGPPYVLLSDSILPLAFTSVVFWMRAIEAQSTLFVVVIVVSTGLLAIPSLWLAVLLVGTITPSCLYHFFPSDPCFLPIRGVINSTPPNCTASSLGYYYCSDWEIWKGFLGVIGSALCSVIFLCELPGSLRCNSQIVFKGTSLKMIQTSFYVSIVLGFASLAFSIASTHTSVDVEVRNCVNASDFYPCDAGYILSPKSTNGYLYEWRTTLAHNWITISAFG